MSEYVISCCSTLDTSLEWVEKRNIAWVPFHFQVGNDALLDNFWGDMSPEEMYRRMVAGEDAKTSQVSPGEYKDHFKKYLDKGIDVLHVCLSSGISGTYNSAKLAESDLSKEYPERKLYIVDSLSASAGFGVLVEKLCRLKEEGKSIDEVRDFAEAHKKEVQHWFFTSDLTFLIKGGRVSKTAGFFGNLLNICPLLNVDFMGRLIAREKIRTKKKVIQRVVEKMEECTVNGTDYDDTCFISNSNVPEDAKAVRDLIEQRFPHMKGKVEIFPIGPTIGCHTGPGTVAVFFWGKERID